MEVIYKGNRVFLVESFTKKGKFYHINLKYGLDGICSCFAFAKNQIWCKHLKELKTRLADKMVGIEGI